MRGHPPAEAGCEGNEYRSAGHRPPPVEPRDGLPPPRSLAQERLLACRSSTNLAFGRDFHRLGSQPTTTSHVGFAIVRPRSVRFLFFPRR